MKAGDLVYCSELAKVHSLKKIRKISRGTPILIIEVVSNSWIYALVPGFHGYMVTRKIQENPP